MCRLLSILKRQRRNWEKETCWQNEAPFAALAFKCQDPLLGTLNFLSLLLRCGKRRWCGILNPVKAKRERFGRIVPKSCKGSVDLKKFVPVLLQPLLVFKRCYNWRYYVNPKPYYHSWNVWNFQNPLYLIAVEAAFRKARPRKNGISLR